MSEPMNKEWRPDQWVNPFSKAERPLLPDDKQERIFEAGASAMLESVVKWLFEPCTEHPIPYADGLADREWLVVDSKSYRLRKDCPQCTESLKMGVKDEKPL
jgi:hypothetical protein